MRRLLNVVMITTLLSCCAFFASAVTIGALTSGCGAASQTQAEVIKAANDIACPASCVALDAVGCIDELLPFTACLAQCQRRIVAVRPDCVSEAVKDSSTDPLTICREAIECLGVQPIESLSESDGINHFARPDAGPPSDTSVE